VCCRALALGEFEDEGDEEEDEEMEVGTEVRTHRPLPYSSETVHFSVSRLRDPVPFFDSYIQDTGWVQSQDLDHISESVENNFLG
jgi:hypothetical protein